MTRERFAELFGIAAMQTIEFTQQFVTNELPEPTRFFVRTNASYDLRPDGTSLTTFPEDTLPEDQPRPPMTGVEAIAFLWRDELVPRWFDVRVVQAELGYTDIELTCCGRYVDEEEGMYYTTWGMGPFGVKGPALPPEWHDKKGEKFDLHWRRHLRPEK